MRWGDDGDREFVDALRVALGRAPLYKDEAPSPSPFQVERSFHRDRDGNRQISKVNTTSRVMGASSHVRDQSLLLWKGIQR